MPNQVPKKEIKKRIFHLKNLHSRKRRDFLLKNLGSTRSAVLERETKNGFTGLTDNYITLLIDINKTLSRFNLSVKKLLMLN